MDRCGAVDHAMLAEIEAAVAAGMTGAELQRTRATLDPVTGPFRDCPRALSLLADVIKALAAVRGWAPEDDPLWADLVERAVDLAAPVVPDHVPPGWGG